MHRIAFAGLTALAALSPAAGLADPAQIAAGQQNPAADAATAAAPTEPGFTTQLFASSRTNLLGDAFGLRTWAQQYGIAIGLQDI